MGGKVDKKVNNGNGPYVFRMSGQNYHKIGTLLPEGVDKPRWAQLYIYDTENEVKNRIMASTSEDKRDSIDPHTVEGLKNMLDRENILAKTFRMARDRFEEGGYNNMKLKLISKRRADGRPHDMPSATEVAALIVNDTQYRLDWIKRHQGSLRTELYAGLQDAIERGDTRADQVGKRILLPSSFTDSPRYKAQNYQDAMAICRWAGYPDLFVTFTCNTAWLEIQSMLQGGRQTAWERPDIVDRVFHIKLKEFMRDIREREYFGKTIAIVYTIEFQKRGLPHAHIVIFLDKKEKKHKYPEPSEVDKITSAEIPDKDIDPEGYAAVENFMMHGPCGVANTNSPCMVDNRSSQKQGHTLVEIEKLMRQAGKTLNDYPEIELPNSSEIKELGNRLVNEEMSYNKEEQREEHSRIFGNLNREQINAFDSIMESIDKDLGKQVFVDGYGGTDMHGGRGPNTADAGPKPKKKVEVA
ncbi:hypothetical protein QYE76_056202 [Lolium multiflorum]|uniref:Helitron helicase-like domain-containing protein n=1 Tax=Lolium multiflorum TaxID=4521 RepID=A0AAD8T2V5_LOLMU|nr:hypothetical protein QYE76_056202 [Lolium multiflorum]